jgi:acetyl esterase
MPIHPGFADHLHLLEGLPPFTEGDDLRPSAEAFAAALAVAGVDVRQVVLRGALHGFLNHSAEIEPVARGLDLVAGVVAGR